jgi:hypothetical protein
MLLSVNTMTEDRNLLNSLRSEVIAQVKHVRSLIDNTLDDGLNITAGIEHFTDLSEGVKSRVCSLDSADMTVLNVVMGKNGRIPAFQSDKIIHIFVADGSIVDLQNGKGTMAGCVYEVRPRRLTEIRSDYARLVVTFKPAFS